MSLTPENPGPVRVDATDVVTPTATATATPLLALPTMTVPNTTFDVILPALTLPTVPGVRVDTRAPSTPVHLYHRMPDAVGSDRRAPRMVVPEEFMAIEPRALERAFFSFYDEEEDDFEMHGAVAVITIDGPLTQRGGWWTDGYEAIRRRVEKALASKAVGALVMKINSPGGVISGCFSSARAMSATKAASGKPVYAYADEAAYSAAYAMATVADEIYLPPEGGVGSVGVIGVLEDWTDFNDKMGIRVAVITSGKHKADGHPDVALKPDVIARYQKRIDSLGHSFASLVADARGMTPESVLKLEADCFYGEEAVTAGLANGVRSLDEVINVAAGEAARRFASTASTKTKGRVSALRKDTTMADKNVKLPEDAGESFVISHAEFALAAGLPHDASKGDILAEMGRVKASTRKLIEAHGATTPEEAVGKLEAERTTHAVLVLAVLGSEHAGKNPTTQDALTKLAADRKVQERTTAEALITGAKAAGKSVGEKTLALFDAHGMAALHAHLDALTPNAALLNTPPRQPAGGGTAPSHVNGAGSDNGPAGSIVVVLSKADEKMIETYGLERESFIAARRAELKVQQDLTAD
jgi:capsid assembly protease